MEADQHSDPAAGLFLQRVEFDVDAARADLAAAFAPIADTLRHALGRASTSAPARASRCSSSRHGHCLGDLLVRFQLDEIPGEVVLVASNHDTNRDLVAASACRSTHCRCATATATRRSTR